MIEALIHGIFLAFGLIIPLGVQNVFIFNQGATQPTLWRAMPAVITAAICDTLLILLAVLGVSLVVLQISWLKSILYLFGILFLSYMGWITWKNRHRQQTDTGSSSLSAKKQIGFAASVSLLNPHAILDTIGVIGTSSLAYENGEKWVFTIACIFVSYLWFFGLALAGRGTGQLDKNGKWLALLNSGSAVIIWGVAAYMAWSLITAR